MSFWLGILALFLTTILCLILILNLSNSKKDYYDDVNKLSKNRLTAHFVYGLWDTDPMPQNFQNTVSAWAKQGCNVKIWDKAMCESLVAPNFLNLHLFTKRSKERFKRQISSATSLCTQKVGFILT